MRGLHLPNLETVANLVTIVALVGWHFHHHQPADTFKAAVASLTMHLQ